MRVSETISFESYYSDSRFFRKKPVLNLSGKYIYGDNIYYKDSESNWVQADSHHSGNGGKTNYENMKRDVKDSNKILIGMEFVYFGNRAIKANLANEAPEKIVNDTKGIRKYRILHSKCLVDGVTKWFNDLEEKGIIGEPINWKKETWLKTYKNGVVI